MSMQSYAKESEIPGQIATQQAQPHVDHSVSAQNLQRKIASITESHAPVHRKVDPTTTVNGVAVNDDPSLEHEADVMGAQAASFTPSSLASGEVAQQEKAPNNTGLPDNLKAGIESMSGMSMDAVKVHYNSEKPAQLNALAYAQGTDIHVGPGQEQHLPHEAWHVVQQGGGGGAMLKRVVNAIATVKYQTRKRDGNLRLTESTSAFNDDAKGMEKELIPKYFSDYARGKYENGREAPAPYLCAEPKALGSALSSIESNGFKSLPKISSVNIHSKPVDSNAANSLRTGPQKEYYADTTTKFVKPCPTCENLLEILPKD